MEELITIFNLLAVPVGWCLVHQLATRRERFSEWRKLAQNSVSDLERIEKKAIKYHTSQNRDIKLEEDILKDIERLESKIHILSQNLTSIKMDNIINFRRAVTLKNFQCNTFRQQLPNSDIYKDITSRTTQIIDALYLAH